MQNGQLRTYSHYLWMVDEHLHLLVNFCPQILFLRYVKQMKFENIENQIVHNSHRQKLCALCLVWFLLIVSSTELSRDLFVMGSKR